MDTSGNHELHQAVFDFIRAFARLEFALRHSGYVHSGPRDAPVTNWRQFTMDHEQNYQNTPAAEALLVAAPRRQVYRNGTISFIDEVTAEGRTALGVVLDAVRTVRNNLFHGGKEVREGWDDPLRIITLVAPCAQIVEEVANLDAVGHPVI